MGYGTPEIDPLTLQPIGETEEERIAREARDAIKEARISGARVPRTIPMVQRTAEDIASRAVAVTPAEEAAQAGPPPPVVRAPVAAPQAMNLAVTPQTPPAPVTNLPVTPDTPQANMVPAGIPPGAAPTAAPMGPPGQPPAPPSPPSAGVGGPPESPPDPYGQRLATLRGVSPPGQRFGYNMGAPPPAQAPPPPQTPGAPPPMQGPPSRPADVLAQTPLQRIGAMKSAGAPAAAPPSAAPARAAPDYTGVDIADAFAAPFRGLARGLQRFGGGSPGARQPTWGEQARARDRQASQAETAATRATSADRLAALRAQRDDRSLGLRERSLDSLDADRRERARLSAERNATLREGQVGRLGVSQSRADTAAGVAGARQASTEQQTEERSALREAGSTDSQTARTALRTSLAGYGPEARARLAREMGVEDLDAAIGPDGSLTATDARALMTRFPQMFRGMTHRRGGGGSGGGGRGRAPAAGSGEWTQERTDGLVRAAVALGMAENVARGMAEDPGRGGGRSPRARLQGMVGRGGMSQGQRRRQRDRRHTIPGYVHRGETELDAGTLRSVRNVATADQEFRSAIEIIERETEGLGTGERLVGVGGVGSERYQQVQHAMGVIRTQFGVLNNVGQSLGAQDRLEHEFPDLSDRTTVGAILNNVRAARTVKHAYVTSLMNIAGFDPAEGGGGHGGGGSRVTSTPSQPGGPGGVRFRIGPNRVTGPLTPAQADAYRERFPDAEQL